MISTFVPLACGVVAVVAVAAAAVDVATAAVDVAARVIGCFRRC